MAWVAAPAPLTLGIIYLLAAPYPIPSWWYALPFGFAAAMVGLSVWANRG